MAQSIEIWKNSDEFYEDDNDYFVMPFYIVCDVSGSMTGRPLEALQQIVPTIKSQMFSQPTLGDILRISVMDFSDGADVLLPMANLMEADIPTFSIKGGTSFEAPFKLLRQKIPQDIVQLKSSGQRVYRPAVFFLTDGYSSPGWEAAFENLTAYDSATDTGFKQYPLFVPMGIGDADEAVLRKLCWPHEVSKLYMARGSEDVAVAVSQMARVMARTVVSTGNTSLAGRPQHLLPTAEDMGNDVIVSQYEGGDEM